MDKFGLKKYSHFRLNFPEFAEVMKTDQDVRALLTLSLSWSKFQLLQLTSYGHKNNRTKTFWARSKTHLAMFHTLMRTFRDQILFAEERGDSNWDSVGVGLIELEANTILYMATIWSTLMFSGSQPTNCEGSSALGCCL